MSKNPHTLSKLLMATGLSVVFALGLAACDGKGGGFGEKKKTEVKAPPSPYAAIANGKVDVEGGVIQVASRRPGTVREVLVVEGQEVKAGDILAKLDDQDSRLQLETSRTQVVQAEAAIKLTQVNLDVARREFARYERLAKENFVAQQKMDTLRDQIKQSEATLISQQAAVSSARAAMNQNAYNQELTNVRAPVDGKIVRRYANPGAGASTLNVTPMFDLEPHAERIIRAEIVESSIPDVKIDQDAEIVPEADQTKVFVGRVKRIAPVFGARKLQSDDPTERADDRVVEVVVSAGSAPFLIGQRVLVKFMKPGQVAGAKREAPKAPAAPAKDAKKAG